MIIDCKEASRLASQALDRRLGPLERMKLGLHLRICAACARFSRQLAFLRRAMARLGDAGPRS